MLGTASSRAEDDAKTILEKAIQAHGGAEAINKYKGMRLKATGKVEVAGGLEFTQEVALMRPDKFKERAELSINGMAFVTESIYNGGKFILKINGTEMKLDNLKDELKQAGHVFEVMRLVPLRDKAYEISLIGDVQVEGKPAVALRVTKKDFRDVTICFDKQTHLIVKTERRAIEPQSGMEFVEERFILEYGKADGLPAAKKVVVNRDGKKYVEAEITETRYLESIDDSEFAVP
jgi:hypothetical protein